MILQEAVGNETALGKVWLYGIDSGNLIQVAAHNERFFKPGAADFLTQDEESSGVIDASKILGDGWFLLDVQAHWNIAATDPELVERGQLLALYIDPKLEASPIATTKEMKINEGTQIDSVVATARLRNLEPRRLLLQAIFRSSLDYRGMASTRSEYRVPTSPTALAFH